MAIREIMIIPDQVLRRKARKVLNFGSELQSLIDDMVDTMRNAPGVGLAATQLNSPLRVIVVEYMEEDDLGDTAEQTSELEEKPKPKLYAIVNPEIIKISNDTEVGTEGCLSVPGFVGDVERSVKITIKGFNRHGQSMRVKAEGWLARIFQHEIDHLDGTLFIDRAVRVWQPEPGETIPLD